MPQHEVGEGVGKIRGNKSRTSNRNKGVGGMSTKKGKETMLRSDSEIDIGWEPWMEAQTSSKKRKTSSFLHCINKSIFNETQCDLHYTQFVFV